LGVDDQGIRLGGGLDELLLLFQIFGHGRSPICGC
jgi:hypothetical protein